MSNAPADIQPDQTGETPGGHLVGVEPAQPRKAADWAEGTQGQITQQQTPQDLVQPEPVQQPAGQQVYYTPEQVEQMIAQARAETNPALEAVQAELREIREAREAEHAAAEAATQAAEEERKQREESEMSAKELLEKREQEWQERFSTLEHQTEQQQIIFAKEKELAELEAYKAQRLQQDAEYILPELRGYVGGNSIEEIDASIERAKSNTSSALGNMQAAFEQTAPPPQPFSQFRGAAPTSPPSGPMEQMEQPAVPDITSDTSMEEYKRHRGTYLSMASQLHQQTRAAQGR